MRLQNRLDPVFRHDLEQVHRMVLGIHLAGEEETSSGEKTTFRRREDSGPRPGEPGRFLARSFDPEIAISCRDLRSWCPVGRGGRPRPPVSPLELRHPGSSGHRSRFASDPVRRRRRWSVPPRRGSAGVPGRCPCSAARRPPSCRRRPRRLRQPPTSGGRLFVSLVKTMGTRHRRARSSTRRWCDRPLRHHAGFGDRAGLAIDVQARRPAVNGARELEPVVADPSGIHVLVDHERLLARRRGRCEEGQQQERDPGMGSVESFVCVAWPFGSRFEHGGLATRSSCRPTV